MDIEARRRLARLINSKTNPRMRVFKIDDSLLTEGEGRIFGRWENPYRLSVNDRNAKKLSALMKVSGHLVAEFESDAPHVLIFCGKNAERTDDNTIFANLIE